MASQPAEPSALDRRFGEVCPPEFRDDIERTSTPKSLQKLDGATAPLLQTYMKVASDGLGIARLTCSSLPILWALDENGEVWFAMEEVVTKADSAFMYPLGPTIEMPDGHAKLGHPCLLRGKGGRIAGEIIFDPEFGENGWVISNKSGRYGYGANRTEAHLRNVATLWAEFGIELDVYYIPPEPEVA